MNLVRQDEKTINLFDRYRLILPPALKHHQDGLPGKRVLFITDCEESFDISFEEDMECMDLTAGGLDRERTVCFEHRSGDQYIHQRRIDRRSTNCSSYCFVAVSPRPCLDAVRMIGTYWTVREWYTNSLGQHLLSPEVTALCNILFGLQYQMMAINLW